MSLSSARRDLYAGSARVALVVGTILVAINEGGAILHGDFSPGVLLRIFLNYAVPFLVSTHGRLSAEPGRTTSEGRPP